MIAILVAGFFCFMLGAAMILIRAKDDDILSYIGAALLFAGGMFIGINTEENGMKRKLVESGHAEYVIKDKLSGETEWQLKEMPKDEKKIEKK